MIFPQLVEFSGQTHNIGPLWEKSLGGIHFSELEDWQAKDLLLKIQAAIKWIENKPEDFKGLEASNGWGTVESSLRYLKAVEKGCLEYPESFYHWSG